MYTRSFHFHTLCQLRASALISLMLRFVALLVLIAGMAIASPPAYAAGTLASGTSKASLSGSQTGIGAQIFADINAGLPAVSASSVAWGDYDNDGRLDILLTGYSSSLGNIARVYHNDGGGSFTAINAGLPGVYQGSVAWGDYDNDGKLDILISGYSSDYGYIARVYHNDGGGSFSDVNAGLPGIGYSSVAWGDYDNDGRLDILLAGSSSTGNIARVYRNNGNGSFSDISAGLPGIGYSSVAWGDYDNDGRLDILLAGSSSTGDIARVYHNNGNGSFTNINAGLPGMHWGSVAWGDYDNDGQLDILISGPFSGYAESTRIYHNNGNGTFTDINAGLPGVDAGSAAWGDDDNDGQLDILLIGNYTARVYRNDGNGSFSDVDAGLPSINIGSAAWGDYDNDGKLDILLTGNNNGAALARVYRNTTNVANTAPSAPSGLAASLYGPSATLSWNAASDAETPASGLTYNLRVGTTPGGSDVVGPMADTSSGFRRVAQLGNTDQRRSWTIGGLTPGQTYYWSAQAVDSAFAGSSLAGEGSFTIKYSPTVDANAGLTVAEGATTTIDSSALKASDVDNTASDVTFVVDTVTARGALKKSGTPIPAGGTFTQDDIDNGRVTYTHDGSETTSDSFAFRVIDGTGGGIGSATFAINVTPVNDAPAIANVGKGGTEDVTLTFVASDFTSQFSDAENAPLAKIQVTSLPANGTLKLSGADVTLNQEIVAASLGSLTFAPNANWNGTTSFGWNGSDGTAYAASGASVTITIAALNDAPANGVPGAQTVGEDSNLVVSGISISDVDAGASDIQVTLSALNGTLTLDTGVASGVIADQVSGNGTNSAIITAPLANIDATLASPSGLTYRGAPNYNGSDTLTVATDDQGNTGGAALGDSATIAITVGAVNDAPRLDPVANLALDEDAGAQTIGLSGIGTGAANESQTLTVIAVSSDPALIPNPAVSYTSPNAAATLSFTPVAGMSGDATIAVTVADDGGTANAGVDTVVRTFTVAVAAIDDAPTLDTLADVSVLENAPMQTVSLSGISAGPADESGQNLTVTATSSNPALVPDPTVGYSSPSATGTLAFAPTANQNGSATITVAVTDSGSNVAPHANTFKRTFVVFVGAVNNRPTFDQPADVTILEDAGVQTVSLSGISAGPANESGQGLTVTASSSNPMLVPDPNVIYSSPNATGSVSYIPAANAFGTATITVRVTDGGGTANGGLDTVAQIFTITIAPVNDAPSFTSGANQSVKANAGARAVAGWAQGFTPGPADESGQTVVEYRVVSNSNPAIFAVAPAIDPAGTLTYTPKAGTSGIATIALVVCDSGGTANDGVDASAAKTFTITVQPFYQVYLPLLQRAGTQQHPVRLR